MIPTKNKNRDDEQLFFFQYYYDLCIKLFGNDERKWNDYRFCFRKLEKYETNHNIKLNEITPEWIKRFKSFLDNDTHLSSSSKYSYFNKLKICLDYAYNERLINTNPAANIDSFKFKYKKAGITYLTLEEVKKLIDVECENQCIKRAFLFSCLTGLFPKEIKALSWSEIRINQDTAFIAFKKKTYLRSEDLYITRHSLVLLGERGADDELIFQDLHSPTTNNEIIKRWVHKAGIDKTVTFQTARYTYISMMVNLETDLHVLSKLLGHRTFQTTSQYIKLMKF